MSVEQINTEEHATYLHHDQAGSTRLITGENGEALGSYAYTPYGAVEAHTGSATAALLYNGQLTSTETGLIYLRARVYDPTTAQFLSVDPAVARTWAPYFFASDNPVNTSDRSDGWRCGERTYWWTSQYWWPEVRRPCFRRNGRFDSPPRGHWGTGVRKARRAVSEDRSDFG